MQWPKKIELGHIYKLTISVTSHGQRSLFVNTLYLPACCLCRTEYLLGSDWPRKWHQTETDDIIIKYTETDDVENVLSFLMNVVDMTIK